MGRIINPLSALARSVLDRGGRVVSATQIEWRVSGNCTAPVTIVRTGRPYVDLNPIQVYDSGHYNAWEPRMILGPQPTGKITVEITARCRKCAQCLRKRANEWGHRASIEVARSARTWFGTITLSPDRAYHYRQAAIARWRPNGDLEAEPDGVLFAKWQNAIAVEFTLMFKRLRNAGYRFRYMLVVEAHQSGTPHFHALVHEQDPEVPLRHAVLTAAWTQGFTNWKLVDKEEPKVVWYAVKYLSKSKLARVRSSLGYGEEIIADDFSPENPPKAERSPATDEHGSPTQTQHDSEPSKMAEHVGGVGEHPPQKRLTVLDECPPF